jgi:hypothetical protein
MSSRTNSPTANSMPLTRFSAGPGAGVELSPAGRESYGWMQPGGYQVVTGLPFMVIEDAPLVHGSPVWGEADGTANSVSPSAVISAIRFTRPVALLLTPAGPPACGSATRVYAAS